MGENLKIIYIYRVYREKKSTFWYFCFMDDFFWYRRDEPGVVVYLGHEVFVTFNETWISEDSDEVIENPRKRWPLVSTDKKSLAWCLSITFEEIK